MTSFSSCENEWTMHGHYCYRVFTAGSSYINWFDAQKQCVDVTSNLASIHDVSEQEHVANLIASGESQNHIWIGLNRTVPHANTWIWTDGTATDYFLWDEYYTGVQQPDDYLLDCGGEACVIIFGAASTWGDVSCTCEYPATGFVCKKRKQR
jgi:hypothetical protein